MSDDILTPSLLQATDHPDHALNGRVWSERELAAIEQHVQRRLSTVVQLLETASVEDLEREPVEPKPVPHPELPTPYSHIYPEADCRHEVCFSPSGPGDHQPVFTAPQMHAFVDADRERHDRVIGRMWRAGWRWAPLRATPAMIRAVSAATKRVNREPFSWIAYEIMLAHAPNVSRAVVEPHEFN